MKLQLLNKLMFWRKPEPDTQQERAIREFESLSKVHLAKLRAKMEEIRKIKAARKKFVPPPLESLTDDQRVRLEEFKVEVYDKVTHFMSDPGGMTVGQLGRKMEMFVQGRALTVPSADRPILFLASELIQQRVGTMLRMALRTSEGKAIAEEDKRIPFPETDTDKPT
jgi:hypothetical protein